jgi:hypothetical protein
MVRFRGADMNWTRKLEQPASRSHLGKVALSGANFMRVHFNNPSEVSFGTAVITPRWLYVLAAATPGSFGDSWLVDETLSAVDPTCIQADDVVSIGIHTANGLRGYNPLCRPSCATSSGFRVLNRSTGLIPLRVN